MGIPLKLLLIEDSPGDADLVVLKLEKSGFDVICQRVEDGAGMWESLKRQTWDVIISDHNLPQFDSLRALQVLKDSGLDIPFIIVSGAIGEEVAVRAMKSGAQDFVPKNNLTRLAAVVEHTVADARGRTARRHAEAAFKESEERFRSLYENSTMGLYRTTPAGQILLANPALIKMLGYSSYDELNKRNLQEEWLEPGYARGKFIESIETHGKVYGWESAWTRKDGTRIYIRESAVAIRDAQGHTLYYDGTVEDITERKKAEAAVISAAEEWRNTFDSISDMVAIIDINHRLVRVNLAFAKTFGTTPAEIIGKKCYEILHDMAGPHASCPFSHTIETGTTHSCEIFEKKLGIPLECTTSPIFDTEHKLIATVHLFKDISERKRTEEALVISEKFSRAIIDNSPIGIAVRDKNHRLVNYNQAWVDLWGMTQKRITLHSRDMTTDEFRILMDHLGEHFDAVENLFQKGGSLSIPELKVTRHKSKEPLWIKQYFYAVCNPAGAVERVIILTVDITERKQAEAENLRLREKAEVSSRLAAVGEMAAGIAHEINNPLTGVIGFSELLLDNQSLPPDIKDQVRIIAEGGNRVKNIVRRMLTFARQSKPVKNSLNIHELIDNTLEIRSYVLKTSNIEVVRTYDPALPWVTVDPGQMQQVFLNLIINAEYSMKKAHGKGKLLISTEKTDHHIRILFTDDGEGMDQTTRGKLFHPFFTTKQVNEGTGLGLSLSRSIILEHSGTIEVESEPGKGATFIITLPVTQPSEEIKPEPAAVNPQVSPRVKPARILIVDDEETIRELVSAVMAQNGHSADTTGDAQEALARLDNTSYDAILMDIRMPGMSGMELYSRITQKHPGLSGKVLFITGDTSDANTRAFLENNNLPYIAKPFDRDALERKVNNLLGGEADAG